MTREADDNLDRLTDAIEDYIEQRAAGAADEDAAAHARTRHLADLFDPESAAGAESARSDATSPVGELPGAGRVIGDYRLHREIGRGGMGVVYEATQISLGRRVALKVLPAHLTLTARQIERFRREATAAARLTHTGIVPIYAVGEAEGVNFFAMELVDGISVSDLIVEARERADGDPTRCATLGIAELPHVTEAAEVVAQVAEALAYAHEQGVIHRDIKSQNILVDRNGKVRLLDFGLAKDLDLASLSHTGEFAGTPHYASPEQSSRGHVEIDPRTDVFSLGVVLYELLTLRRPFDGDTHQEVLFNLNFVEPKLIRHENPVVPRDLETICHKAIEKDRRNRYPSAHLMAEDVRRFLRRLPILARPIGPLRRAIRHVRRHRWATAALALAFLLFVVTPIVAMLYFKDARDALAAEQAATAEQRDNARSNLALAKRAVDQMFTRYSVDLLADTPSTVAFRRQLLQDALDFYSKFRRLSGDDPAYEHSMARTSGYLGRVLSELGDEQASVRHLLAALEGFEAAHQRVPRDPIYRFDLGSVHHQIASAKFNLGGYDDVEAHYERSIELLEGLIDDPNCQNELRDRALVAIAHAYRQRGLRVQSRSGDSLRGRAAVESAWAVWDRIGEADIAKNPRYRGDRAFIGIAFARILLRQGEVDRAIDLSRDAASALKNLATEWPHFMRFRSYHADACHTLAAALLARGKRQECIAQLERAVALGSELLELYPERQADRNRYAQYAAKLAQQLLLSNRMREGYPHSQRAVEVAEKLVGDAPQQRNRLVLASAINVRALYERYKKTVDPESIDEMFSRSINAYEECLAARPGQRFPAVQLAGVLSNFAEWRINGLRDGEAARELLNRAIAIQSDCYQTNPRDPTIRAFMASHHRLLTLALGALGEFEDLATAAERYVGELGGDSVVGLVIAARMLGIASSGEEVADERRGEWRQRGRSWLERAISMGFPVARVEADATLAELR